MKTKFSWILSMLLVCVIQTQAQQNIYVNQVGYLTGAPKYFYTDYAADSFAVVNTETRLTVFEGKMNLRKKKDPLAGFDIYSGSFTGLKTKGSYVIKVFSSLNSGIVSYPFEISDEVFTDLLLLANRSIFMQRCGIALEEKYVGKYYRDVCHLNKAHYHLTNKMEGTKDMTGGWHDAGDYGKYVAPGSVTIATLLLANELKPEQFKSDNWNIPESGNGIPDLLDEVKYELDWMFKMQRNDGAVHEKIHTKDYVQFVMPSYGNVPQFIYEVSSTATADFAAVMAYSSRVFAKYNLSYSEKCLKAALKAYDFLDKHPEIFPPGGFKNPADTKAGGYSDAQDNDERLWAAAELFFTTGEKKYHKDFLELNENFDKKFIEAGWNNPVAFAHYAYLLKKHDKIDEKVKEKIKSNLVAYADKHVELASKDGFRIAMQARDYIWGSNGHLLNKAINLIIAYELTDEKKYRDLALTHLDNVLGTNAMKMCYVTGIGTKRILHLHHAPSVADVIAEPVPGIMTEGPNRYLQDGALKNLFTKETPPAKTYVDDAESYASNENTIYGNASLIFVVAYLNGLDFKE